MNICEYLSTKLNSGDGCIVSKHDSMYAEVQADISNSAVYHTLDVTKGMNKYKYGFLIWNSEINCCILMAFNKAKDFCELIGYDDDEYDDLEAVEVMESYKMSRTETSIRIW